MAKINYSIVQAIAAAVLFGASIPFLKLLLINIGPIYAAAYLYLGSSLIYLFYRITKLINKNTPAYDDRLRINDLPWLAGAILTGGIAAPIALALGLRSTLAATASLLLNFEIVATVLLAGFLFGERLGKRVWAAAILIFIAGLTLTLAGSSNYHITVGSLGILIACFFWGMDNNLTRKISLRNPLVITSLKGLFGGACSLILAIFLGGSPPSMATALRVMLIGLFCYGCSISFYILTMRNLGAARASAYFASAPFAGALISFILFKQFPNEITLLSFFLMLAGIILLISEKHQHVHFHGSIEHDHLHDREDMEHLHQH